MNILVFFGIFKKVENFVRNIEIFRNYLLGFFVVFDFFWGIYLGIYLGINFGIFRNFFIKVLYYMFLF